LILDPVTGLKLSKQNHATALDTRKPLQALNAAWQALGFNAIATGDEKDFLSRATVAWALRFGL